jgi:membrane fusion protein (multidrug efflux system)
MPAAVSWSNAVVNFAESRALTGAAAARAAGAASTRAAAAAGRKVLPARKGAQDSAPALVALGVVCAATLALIAGGYWYVTGGRVMSTDDAYVEADKVGISTDVSGIVKEIDVGNNQHVEGGQVLYRLDDLPFRFALERAEAQVGI